MWKAQIKLCSCYIRTRCLGVHVVDIRKTMKKTCWYANFFLLSFTLFTAVALRLSVVAVQRPLDIKNRPRIPIPDEDPYSVASNELENSGASGSSGEIGRERIAVTKEQLIMQMNGKRSEKPPKLPPRDNIYPQVRLKVSYFIFSNFTWREISDFTLIVGALQNLFSLFSHFHFFFPPLIIHIQPDYDDIEDRKISARRKSEKGKNSKSYGEFLGALAV